jgi:Ca2+/Na+ antiporter
MTDDDAKDEALRMLDDDEWQLSLWEFKQHRTQRTLFILFFGMTVVGLVVIPSLWHRLLMVLTLLFVLYGYLWTYGYRIEIPIARLRSHIRSRLQTKGGRQARDGGLKA